MMVVTFIVSLCSVSAYEKIPPIQVLLVDTIFINDNGICMYLKKSSMVKLSSGTVW